MCDFPTGFTMDKTDTETMYIARKELFEVWHKESPPELKNKAVLNFVLHKLGLNESEEVAILQDVKKSVKNVNNKFAKKWADARRTLKDFLQKNSEWLNANLTFSILSRNEPMASTSTYMPSNIGRPIVPFLDSSTKTKKRKVGRLLKSHSNEELTFAAATSLWHSGRKDAASVVKEVSDFSPERATRMKKAFITTTSALTPIKYSDEEALALYVDGDFTKQSYILMQRGAKHRHANIYPSYYGILNAKKACYPEEASIYIDETLAEIQLQALIDHTLTRLTKSLHDEIESKIKNFSPPELTMIFKWGCDGSSSHSTYKQKFNTSTATDAFLFSIFIVPLQLYGKHNDDNVVIWQNDRPSSTRFCRPVKIMFQKESTELVRKEISNMENQIKDLASTKLTIDGQEISINSILSLTMIDGKTFNVVADTPSSQTCGICGATPKDMNILDKVQSKLSDSKLYEYGLSSLHAWIRCLECLLHISYRLGIKTWQIRGKKNKNNVAARKASVQEKLKLEMGLLVDIPKPGYGTTNDGNTARRFFQDPSTASLCTGIDIEIIKRFGTILKAITSGFSINIDAFTQYAKETSEKYVELYPWYYMPASVHKLLIHGSEIIKASVLPIGLYSEEALESRNKDLRNYREYHSRKSSREKTMQDLLHALLYSSDPLISSISCDRNVLKHKFSDLGKEVQNLLNVQIPQSSSSEYTDSD